VSCNVIQAKWLSEGFPLQIDSSTAMKHAGKIEKIFSSKVTADGQTKMHLILKVAWYAAHDNVSRFGHHVTPHNTGFCVEGPYTYIPIQRVLCKCALFFTDVDHVKCVVVIQLLGIWAIG
jgi:hypothetical protein